MRLTRSGVTASHSPSAARPPANAAVPAVGPGRAKRAAVATSRPTTASPRAASGDFASNSKYPAGRQSSVCVPSFSVSGSVGDRRAAAQPSWTGLLTIASLWASSIRAAAGESASVRVKRSPSGFGPPACRESGVTSTPSSTPTRPPCPGSVTRSTTSGWYAATPGREAARRSSTTDRATPNSPLPTYKSPTRAGVSDWSVARPRQSFSARDETSVATPTAMLATMSAARSQRCHR